MTVILKEQKTTYDHLLPTINKEATFANISDKIGLALGMRRSGKTLFTSAYEQKLNSKQKSLHQNLILKTNGVL